MKSIKPLVLIPILFYFISVSAQTEAGNYILGLNSVLNVNYTSITYENYGIEDSPKLFQINFSPRIGYFIVENLGIGVGVEIRHLSNKPNDSETIKENTTIGAVFVRYYIPNDVVRPFIEAGGGIGQVKTAYDFANANNNEDFTSNMLTYSIIGGLAIPIGKKVTFDLGLGYGRSIVQPQTNPNDLKTKLGIVNFSVGFLVYLGNGKITKV